MISGGGFGVLAAPPARKVNTTVVTILIEVFIGGWWIESWLRNGCKIAKHSIVEYYKAEPLIKGFHFRESGVG